MASVRHFRELKVWQIANEIRKDVYRVTNKFPPTERYTLIPQLRRAAHSIAANIAEGYGRFHYRENIQFCRQARGSLEEVCDGIGFAGELQLLPAEELRAIDGRVDECHKVLNAYIQAIQKRKNERQATND
ncbi:MAG: hypothetical protein A3B37_00145 [Candidatus Sungbacteria bacterium RIFCSPLOWO2_01_FULL_59_16]|uniref:Four helix bundle protein n=1 Tax=Candidatus Sungbacteria bacterium RIFCSPLOWO2_01_FULL_59_16 TaxID=1802280 RepID=A0A1G2LAA2_9BACT|nr:MAG: hypothetical protein A3B37_00145 [Candidatus Sungbacteria bacterium RIFCSPLOWO2_01_FULL_59_16]